MQKYELPLPKFPGIEKLVNEPDDQKITFLIMESEEFEEFVSMLDDVIDVSTGEVTESFQLDVIRDKGYIPMMSHGSKTQHIFDKYEVKTQLMSVIISGRGMDLLKESLTTSKDS